MTHWEVHRPSIKGEGVRQGQIDQEDTEEEKGTPALLFTQQTRLYEPCSKYPHPDQYSVCGSAFQMQMLSLLKDWNSLASIERGKEPLRREEKGIINLF